MSADTFGTLLRRHRFAAGLSQNALARAVGVNPAYINQLERQGDTSRNGRAIRRVSPSRGVVLAIAVALRLTEAERDRLLHSAGHAPVIDWQTRAEHAEGIVAAIRANLGGDPAPALLRSVS